MSEPPGLTEGGDVGGHRPPEGDGAGGKMAFGRNPRHFGIDPDEPWPDDVPMDQDDTHWRYENDPEGARRAELRIAACWTVTVAASIGLAAVYVTGGNTQWAGVCWGLAFVGLGAGLILWARDLMPGLDVIASRGHHGVSLEGDRDAVAESMERGLVPMARRPFLFKVLGAVGGVFGIASLFPFASLGPRPGNDLWHTGWRPGKRAVTFDNTPVRPGDLAVGGMLSIFPEGYINDALSLTLLFNLGSTLPAGAEIPGSAKGWNIGSLVAFSAICTHAGCPVKLYNVTTEQLVCPCHQSTFDLLKGCKPVFGPAPRSLPQLPITVDASGFIVSQQDYTTPVGPGFWERG